MSVVSDPGRDGRLTWSKYAEHEARKELSAIAIRKCDAHLAAFSRCAREQNLLVVFNCRAENRRMNVAITRGCIRLTGFSLLRRWCGGGGGAGNRWP